jgi:diadenylate cyclase
MGLLLNYLVPLIEIGIIWVMVSYILKFFWGTRAMDVVFGFIAFLFLFFLASWFGFHVLERILYNVVNVAVIALFVIFQPEIRLFLSKIRIKARKFKEVRELDDFIEAITKSVYRFSEKGIGALVVLENHDSFKEYASSSLDLNADFSSELLESIFTTSAPLHDGAVVIRGNTILAAGVILPLAHETAQLTKSMGTRHRAALGASQKSDALIICVSEETGKVSIARDGVLTRGVKIDRFRGILRSIFAPVEVKKKMPLWSFAS